MKSAITPVRTQHDSHSIISNICNLINVTFECQVKRILVAGSDRPHTVCRHRKAMCIGHGIFVIMFKMIQSYPGNIDLNGFVSRCV